MRTLLVILLLSPWNLFAQLSKEQISQVDSIKLVIKTAKHDTIIVNGWSAWDNIIYLSDPQLDFELNKKIVGLCAKNLNNSISKQEKNFFLKAQGSALNVIGIIYKNQGHYAKAIDNYTRSLKIHELVGDKSGISTTLGNIGNIYSSLNENKKAIQYHTRSLKIKKEMHDMKGIASSLNNLGNIYSQMGNGDKAIIYFNRSLKIRKDLDDDKGIAQCLANAGNIYETQGNDVKALDYYNQSLKIREDIGDKAGIANSLNYIGDINQKKGDYLKSIEYNLRSLMIAQEIGSANEIKEASESLYECYEKIGQHKLALDMHKLYVQTRDSLDSEDNQKEVIRQEFKYEYEKKNAIQKAENEKDKLKVKQQKQQAYLLYGGLALALLFGGFIFNRFRVTIKQKEIIEFQKQQVDLAFDELAVKNSEILDSISYAKRIQSAILPSKAVVKEHLKDSFILYKPKNIIAGDFYWLEEKSGIILFAAADCTGHGVPGAMVSVVCNNGLNRSVREHGLTDPGEILDKTREIVIQEFEKSADDVKDGMDIALCSLEGKNLKYAGANNPLWIVRKGEISETKADKQPICKSDNKTNYTTYNIELQPDDIIYIFSDGYVDQFGGEKGKKFKANAFRTLIRSIHHLPMEEQGAILDATFENWRGDLEQNDDVCVIGVRV